MSCHSITAEHVRLVLQDAGIHFCEPFQHIIDRGQSGLVFSIGGDPGLVVKIQPRLERFHNVTRESTALHLLERCSWCPRIVANGMVEEVGRYVIEERLPGVPLFEVWLQLNEKERMAAGRTLGNIMQEMHQAVSFEECGDFLSNYLTLEDLLIDKLQSVSRDLKSALIEKRPDRRREIESILSEARLFFGSKIRNQGIGPPYHLIHNDFHFGNILYDPERGRVVGIVDFELTLKAAPLFDLLRLYYSVHWPRRFAYPNSFLRESYHNIKLLSLWEGIKEAYPFPFEIMGTTSYLLCASIIYDLEALVKSVVNGWSRSVQDNLKRLNYNLAHQKLYDGPGWL